MVFSISPSGFVEFITQPFRSFTGWILLIGVAIYIWLRLTGRIGFKRDQQSNSGGNVPDYEIK